MSDRVTIGLDNPVFRGRLRQPVQHAQPYRTARQRLPRPSARYINDVVASRRPVVAQPELETRTIIDNHQTQFRHFVQSNLQPGQTVAARAPLDVIQPQQYIKPAGSKQQRSHVLKRQLVQVPTTSATNLFHKLRSQSKLQITLVGLACLIFILGLAASIQGFQTNHFVAVQVSALSKKSKPPTTTGQAANSSTVPGTTKPSALSFSQYTVAPDLPRYLKIPKLGVYARVLQVGVTKTGALGTPNNVYDTAWYTGSAKPGQPGATLIDGHVSSWTAHGVFYGIKTLVVGDMIQIIRGDGAVLNYQVVKTQVYGANNVDMQAAVTPITAGKSGLNLITCTGQVKPGTSEFNERVVVFAQQV
jgi:sortase (surface protein transpeptidase)